MQEWARQLADVLRRERCVVVTMNPLVGSSPREAGCRMIVTDSELLGSIGGGNLEYKAISHARELLARGSSPRQEHQPYALGPALNQCCGGTVTLLFERFEAGVPGWLKVMEETTNEQQPLLLASAIDRDVPFKALISPLGAKDPALPEVVTTRGRDLLRGTIEDGVETMQAAGEQWWLEPINSPLKPLILFGAGHVGQAVARLLEDMPFNVNWVDDRPDIFPGRTGSNINTIKTDDVLAEVGKAPPGSTFVVMTHSHELDEDICYQVLSRGDFAWLGLIGSVTKRRRFVQRLAQRGIDEPRLSRLVCPVGLSSIKGKQPATIALSLVAQLMSKPGLETVEKDVGGSE